MLYYINNDFINHFRNSPKFINKRLPMPEKEVAPEKSISICTTCMNRLHDIQKTLPKNLKDSESYKNVEFVLLDYGSTDGLDRWVRDKMRSHLISGRLVYYRTEARYFRPNHSRNVSFRLAKGDIVANVDSDNFIHQGYLERINQCMSVSDSNVVAIPETFLLPQSNRLRLMGRFAVYKSNLEELTGFDEDLDKGYGNDDVNFIFRAMLLPCVLVPYEKEFCYGRIETPLEKRIELVDTKSFSEGNNRNKHITALKLGLRKIAVNKNWGVAHVVRNFKTEIDLDAQVQ